MRKIGYSKVQIEHIRLICEQGKTILVHGLKNPQNYLQQLGAGFKAEPYYATPSQNNRFHFYEEKVTEYLPTLIGYIFERYAK